MHLMLMSCEELAAGPMQSPAEQMAMMRRVMGGGFGADHEDMPSVFPGLGVAGRRAQLHQQGAAGTSASSRPLHTGMYVDDDEDEPMGRVHSSR